MIKESVWVVAALLEDALERFLASSSGMPLLEDALRHFGRTVGSPFEDPSRPAPDGVLREGVLTHRIPRSILVRQERDVCEIEDFRQIPVDLRC